eukprot:CAMPEP_0113940976 /NCGR_PEP_ID=MMETSP1339-20121228/6999_1 /TAXON_ID=94617 /ORGANISM="Fibrocapsa japonica" /LENGTH=199 /DNA_ID=CAMNT_0000944989 /DNA_START=94 /DNA_END=693 /DNA_ORIENTATION=+ /assembly_acc=CAM_ASM_000762
MSSLAVDSEIDVADLAKIFGRLSEKEIFMDPAVGACCHSACTDCEWRKPDGGYRFDLIRSGRPKWIPTYIERDFKDSRGCHVPQWSEMFGESAELSKEDFKMKLVDLKFSMPMGPSGFLSGQPEPSDLVLDSFWNAITSTISSIKNADSDSISSISSKDFTDVLQKWSMQDDVDDTRGPDFVDWNAFQEVMVKAVNAQT